MKKFALSIALISITSSNLVFAQCGLHREVQERVEPFQKSSVVIPEGTKDYKSLARVSKKEAKKVAKSNYPGKIKIANLEVVGEKLVWKLEVKGNEGQKEIFIDPANGEFLGYGLTK